MTLSRDIVKFNANTSARDKIFRIIQYGSRLVLWQLTHGSPHTKKQVVEQLKKLETALALSRKLFRMGNSMDFFHKALDALNRPFSYLNALTIISLTFKAIWLLMDHLLWLRKVELVKVDLAYWTRWSLRAWLAALASGTVADLLKLDAVQKKVDQHHRDNKDSKVLPAPIQIEMHSTRLNFWRNFLDVCIPLGGLGYISPGIGALCGTLSSFIGFQQEWEKHIQPFEPTGTRKSS